MLRQRVAWHGLFWGLGLGLRLGGVLVQAGEVFDGHFHWLLDFAKGQAEAAKICSVIG